MDMGDTPGLRTRISGFFLIVDDNLAHLLITVSGKIPEPLRDELLVVFLIRVFVEQASLTVVATFNLVWSWSSPGFVDSYGLTEFSRC